MVRLVLDIAAKVEIMLIKNPTANILNHKDCNGRTPFMLASSVANNGDKLCKFLFEHGANPNDSSRAGDTPLRYSVCNNNVDLCKLLLEHGAKKVDQVNKNGETALMLAASHDYTDICKLLLEHAADPYKVNKYGRTTLSLATGEAREYLEKVIAQQSKLPAAASSAHDDSLYLPEQEKSKESDGQNDAAASFVPNENVIEVTGAVVVDLTE